MPDYRRAYHSGGTYFFTVNLLQRAGNDLLVRHIDLLRESVRKVRHAYPFEIHGWVVLPDHLHCVIRLPTEDSDFTTRWRLIKAGFSRALPKTERLSQCVSGAASGASGSGASGSTSSATRPITGRTWITSTSIR